MEVGERSIEGEEDILGDSSSSVIDVTVSDVYTWRSVMLIF
jgi:hypothetical protein